jgi:hypothetical protein
LDWLGVDYHIRWTNFWGADQKQIALDMEPVVADETTLLELPFTVQVWAMK